jgi:hypothetical protein
MCESVGFCVPETPGLPSPEAGVPSTPGRFGKRISEATLNQITGCNLSNEDKCLCHAGVSGWLFAACPLETFYCQACFRELAEAQLHFSVELL